MKKKREYPRKRKRFLKKIVIVSGLLLSFAAILCGVALYFLIVKMQKPLYISPLPKTYAIQSVRGDTTYSQLQNGLKKDQIAFSSITRGMNSYVVTLQNGGKVTFSTQKDIMTQIASLQYILSHLTMEGRQFSSLDLRYDKPVIVIK